MTIPNQTTRFKRLQIRNWRQFENVDIDLSNRLTILTGANATGKTTLLTLLGRHFNWQTQFLSALNRRGGGVQRYTTGSGLTSSPAQSSVINAQMDVVGELTYSAGESAELAVPRDPNAISYDVQVHPQQFVPGLYLSSHRSISSYQGVTQIPAQFNAGEQILEQYLSEIRNRFFGGYSGRSAMLVMKESLLAAALYGFGSEAVTADSEAAAVWNGFQATLKLVLPASLEFLKLRSDPPEIVMETGTGDFPIDAVSGGLSAMMELAWQIFLRSRQYSDFTVCFDEPENHLHPSLQRSLLPSLLRAFPSVGFVVATHSPFVVTSSPDANVHVLNRSERRVSSELLDLVNKAGPADETLRDVLGVTSVLPLWAEDRFNEIVSRYTGGPPTPDGLRQLRDELRAAGLASTLPSALSQVMDEETGGER